MRQHAIDIWNAGLNAVRAEPLVIRETKVQDGQLWLSGTCFDRADYDRVIVVGAGKAGSAMAAGFHRQLSGWLPIVGWVNVPENAQRSIDSIITHPGRPAGVNEPTQAGVHGTEQIMKLVHHANQRDLVVALISGGGSALLPLPSEGISLVDKLAVIRHLSETGATIDQLNTVRKHLSDVKGGGLLRHCRGGHLVTLVLSDVLGDPLDLIASGPTVIDTSTPSDALNVLSKFDPDRILAESIYESLESQKSVITESPSCPSTVIMLGNNALAVDEAGIKAESLGYNHVMQSATSSEGLAEDVGEHLANMTVDMLRADSNQHRTDCLITGGEPTVQLVPTALRGKGGRNQQLVLAAYRQLQTFNLTESEWNRVAILSGGTDGEDGPTDAAGAVLDASVHLTAQRQQLDVDDFLARNDAYRFFEKTSGLLLTGPTGTNVCDVRVSVVGRPH